MRSYAMIRIQETLYALVHLVSLYQDAAVTPASAQALCQTVPEARFINMPELGHLAHEENPHAVAAAVLAVLAPSTT